MKAEKSSSVYSGNYFIYMHHLQEKPTVGNDPLKQGH